MDKFKLPLWLRIFIMIFYSKDERMLLTKRINIINADVTEQENQINEYQRKIAALDENHPIIIKTSKNYQRLIIPVVKGNELYDITQCINGVDIQEPPSNSLYKIYDKVKQNRDRREKTSKYIRGCGNICRNSCIGICSSNSCGANCSGNDEQ
jgi:hypothetical protein